MRRLVICSISALIALSACSSNPDDESLATDTGDAADDAAESRCGDGVRDEGEVCDQADLAGQTCQDQGFEAGDLGCDATCALDTSLCRRVTCGDGIVDDPESCDDGNTEDGDGCSAACVLESCGDGTLQADEACDGDDLGDATCVSEGFLAGDLLCAASCVFDTSGCIESAACGDGILNEGEACDDGNAIDGDGCAFDCVLETCGDGIVHPDEACDGGAVLTDACDGGLGITLCSDTCELEPPVCPEDSVCGDGEVELGESCDVDDPALCDAACTSMLCGDGTLQAHEVCDGELINQLRCQDFGFGAGELQCDACTLDLADCHHPRCGDGRVEAGEACDDGNREAGDGCSARCRLEACGDGAVGEDEGCDEGEGNSDEPGATCRTNCQPARCGDGILDMLAGEACDLGAVNSDDPGSSCHTDCQLPACGDGILDVGEACDQGVALNTDEPNAACRPACVLPSCGDGVHDDALGEACDDGNADDDVCTSLCEPANQPPVAVAQYTPAPGTPGGVSFNGFESYDPDGTIAFYYWEYGDGRNSGLSEPAPGPFHIYAESGTYTATLTVTDNLGATAVDTVDVDVEVQTSSPPSASVVVNVRAQCSPMEVSFDAAGSTDADGDIVAYVWDFDDGSPVEVTAGETVTHTYVNDTGADASHLPTVTVRDAAGGESTASAPVTVYPPVDPGVALWIGENGLEIPPWSEPLNWCTATGPQLPDDTLTVRLMAGRNHARMDMDATVGGIELTGVTGIQLEGHTLTVMGDVLSSTPEHLAWGDVPGTLVMAGDDTTYQGQSPILEVRGDRVAIGGSPENVEIYGLATPYPATGSFVATDLVVYPGGTLELDGGGAALVFSDVRIEGALHLTAGGGINAMGNFAYGATGSRLENGSVSAGSFEQLPTGEAFDPTAFAGGEVLVSVSGDPGFIVSTAGPNQARFDRLVIDPLSRITTSDALLVAGTMVVNGDLVGTGAATIGSAVTPGRLIVPGTGWQLEGDSHHWGPSTITGQLAGPMTFHTDQVWTSSFSSARDVTFTDGATFNVPPATTSDVQGTLTMDGGSVLHMEGGSTLVLSTTLDWQDASSTATGGDLVVWGDVFVADTNTRAIDLGAIALDFNGAGAHTLSVGTGTPSFLLGTLRAYEGVALTLSGAMQVSDADIRDLLSFASGSGVFFERLSFADTASYDYPVDASVGAGTCLGGAGATVVDQPIAGCQ